MKIPKCPLCKSHQTRFFATKSKYNYYRCSDCSTLFLFPQPTYEENNSYYTDPFVYRMVSKTEQRIRKQTRAFIHEMQLLRPGKTLLDVGSGYGFLLDEATKIGLSCEGIEPSKTLYKNSKKEYHLTVHNTTLEEFHTTKKFDFITCVHTIEHVTDPVSIISSMLSLLKPGGMLYLETPNLDSHLFDAEQTHYTFLTPPDHPWLFSHTSFRFMLKGLPISRFRVSTFSYPEHLMGILKRRLHTQPVLHETGRTPPVTKSVTTQHMSLKQHLSYHVVDQFLAPLCTPLLNVQNKGSMLQVFVQKM